LIIIQAALFYHVNLESLIEFNDDFISQEEWDEFLRVHGFEKKSEG